MGTDMTDGEAEVKMGAAVESNGAMRAARARRAAAGSSLVFAIAIACGPAAPGGEPAPVPGPSAQAEAFADEVVEAFCDGLGSCCTALSRTFDRASCEANARTLIAKRAPVSDDVRFDPAAAEQCLANIRAALPTCSGIEDEPCGRIYVGTLAPGEACDRYDECAPIPGGRTYCLDVCKAARRAAEGESCVRTCRSENECGVLTGEPIPDIMSLTTRGECFAEDGLACVGGVCVRAPGQGAACLDGWLCDRGLDCDNDTCVPLPAVGEPCTSRCASGAYCGSDSALNSVCVPYLALGEPCSHDQVCSSRSCGTHACTQDSCAPACQSPTLGRPHGSAAECAGTVHF
ncbi:uncharacterized protein SOCEGT47_082600 [Sorangium cellulosum]|uniref:Uncharacterized protein n=1 Tax=Sorangium cellulosum TaxID=56 RepID=A0A4V0NEX2_SORCE|nr:hypothetical protein [Sorangium cellulosum]AUX27662.1 uncharacterized protein SOCEGT47_082600 [Sorangium cellulosum]